MNLTAAIMELESTSKCTGGGSSLKASAKPSQTPQILVLDRSKAVPVIEFDDVTMGTLVERVFVVQNPGTTKLTLHITDIPYDKGVTFEADSR